MTGTTYNRLRDVALAATAVAVLMSAAGYAEAQHR